MVSQWPEDRRYTQEHEWVKAGGGIARIGVTAYAADALGDIVYATLPMVGAEVLAGDACAELESTKSVSDVYTPCPGVIASINEALADAPETINADPFGEGWLFEVEITGGELSDGLLDAEAYDRLISGLGG